MDSPNSAKEQGKSVNLPLLYGGFENPMGFSKKTASPGVRHAP